MYYVYMYFFNYCGKNLRLMNLKYIKYWGKGFFKKKKKKKKKYIYIYIYIINNYLYLKYSYYLKI